MKLLELFCGTKSVGKEFAKLGYEVTSVDNDPQFDPDICLDIREFEPTEYYDVVWASPPCEGFSVMNIGRNWTHEHEPKTDQARLGLELLERTLYIIETIKPKYFFIENPRAKMRRMPQLDKYHRDTVSYCQYGDKRMKPTDIWHNSPWIPRPMCKRGSPCHVAAPRGSRTGTQGMESYILKAVIPAELCREIALATL